jgi:hypothetical protein
MTISAGKVEPLKTFLGQYVFRVPEYQRGFEWTHENIEQFHKTIMNCTEDNNDRFIGTVILRRENEKKDGDEVVQLVDGQQRITTVFMYLSALRDRFHELVDIPLPPEGKVKVPIDPKSRCQDLLYDTAKEDHRLHANMLIRDLFERCVIADPGDDGKGKQRPALPKRHKSYTKRFRAAARQIQRKLDEAVSADLSPKDKKDVFNKIFKALTTNLRVLAITTDSQLEAMQIFTTMNTTGLGLSPSDIVKGQIFTEIVSATLEDDRSDVLDELQKEWQFLIDNLGEDIDMAMRHYFLGRVGSKFQLGDLDTKVEEELGKAGASRNHRARELLDRFKEMAVVYNDLLNPNTTTADRHERFQSEILQCLNLMNVSARVLFLAVKHPNETAPVASSEDVSRIFQHTEAVVYRWTMAGANAQQLEDKFTSIAFAFQSGTSPEKICEMLSGQLQPEDQIRLSLSEPLTDPRQARSILYRIHQYLGDIPRFLRFDGSVLEVEHIAPKSGTEEWYKALGRESSSDGADDPESYEYQAEMLGNKTLLEQHINAQIKQLNFDKKRSGASIKVGRRDFSYSGYENSKVDMTKQLSVHTSTWDVAAIELRNDWLVDCFLRVFTIPQKLDQLEQYVEFVMRKSPAIS